MLHDVHDVSDDYLLEILGQFTRYANGPRQPVRRLLRAVADIHDAMMNDYHRVILDAAVLRVKAALQEIASDASA